MAIEYTTPAGQVRLLISDVDDADMIFTDDQITGFLAVNNQHPKRAAASALLAIAASSALISKVIRTQDLQTDGAKLADALRGLAAQYKKEADDEDDRTDSGFFDIVDYQPWPASGPELAEPEIL